MICRKAPLQPTRLLLRVVSAGAGALLAAACSSGGVAGDVATPAGGVVSDAGADADAQGLCANMVCGSVVNPEGGEEYIAVGVVPQPEGGVVVVVPVPTDGGGGGDATDEQPLVGLIGNPEGGDEFVGGGVFDGPVGEHRQSRRGRDA